VSLSYLKVLLRHLSEILRKITRNRRIACNVVEISAGYFVNTTVEHRTAP
jgi:hypothetical protein